MHGGGTVVWGGPCHWCATAAPLAGWSSCGLGGAAGRHVQGSPGWCWRGRGACSTTIAVATTATATVTTTSVAPTAITTDATTRTSASASTTTAACGAGATTTKATTHHTAWLSTTRAVVGGWLLHGGGGTPRLRAPALAPVPSQLVGVAAQPCPAGVALGHALPLDAELEVYGDSVLAHPGHSLVHRRGVQHRLHARQKRGAAAQVRLAAAG